MSAGEIAGLIAAIALAVLVLLLAIPLLKLGRTLDETTLTIRQAREQSAPILTQASTTVAHVNSNLERVDDITGNAANVSSNVAALTSVVAATVDFLSVLSLSSETSFAWHPRIRSCDDSVYCGSPLGLRLAASPR